MYTVVNNLQQSKEVIFQALIFFMRFRYNTDIWQRQFRIFQLMTFKITDAAFLGQPCILGNLLSLQYRHGTIMIIYSVHELFKTNLLQHRRAILWSQSTQARLSLNKQKQDVNVFSGSLIAISSGEEARHCMLPSLLVRLNEYGDHVRRACTTALRGSSGMALVHRSEYRAVCAVLAPRSSSASSAGRSIHTSNLSTCHNQRTVDKTGRVPHWWREPRALQPRSASQYYPSSASGCLRCERA